MQWLYQYSSLFGIVCALVSGWGLLVMSAAGRTRAWWGMMTVAILFVPITFTNAAIGMGFISQAKTPPVYVAMLPLSVLHAICLAVYSRRLSQQALRAKALEEECAELSLRLTGQPQPPVPRGGVSR